MSARRSWRDVRYLSEAGTTQLTLGGKSGFLWVVAIYEFAKAYAG
jgi:hypothetical protein